MSIQDGVEIVKFTKLDSQGRGERVEVGVSEKENFWYRGVADQKWAKLETFDDFLNLETRRTDLTRALIDNGELCEEASRTAARLAAQTPSGVNWLMTVSEELYTKSIWARCRHEFKVQAIRKKLEEK